MKNHNQSTCEQLPVKIVSHMEQQEVGTGIFIARIFVYSEAGLIERHKIQNDNHAYFEMCQELERRFSVGVIDAAESPEHAAEITQFLYDRKPTTTARNFFKALRDSKELDLFCDAAGTSAGNLRQALFYDGSLSKRLALKLSENSAPFNNGHPIPAESFMFPANEQQPFFDSNGETV